MVGATGFEPGLSALCFSQTCAIRPSFFTIPAFYTRPLANAPATVANGLLSGIVRKQPPEPEACVIIESGGCFGKTLCDIAGAGWGSRTRCAGTGEVESMTDVRIGRNRVKKPPMSFPS
jgi:hypothetical protein